MDDNKREVLLDGLNEDECRTLYWLCRGLSRTDMAQKLFVSESAVYYRLAKIWEKLDVDHLERHVRLHVLVQDFCPLVLDRVEDPERDCRRFGRAGDSSADEEAPAPETIETVKGDEQTGLIPITQSIVRRPKRDSGGQPPIVIDYRGTPARPRTPRWLAPALLGIAFLLGVVAVLLVLNLTRQPEQQVVVVTSTPVPVQHSEGTNTPDALQASMPTERPTYTPYPTLTPYPTHTPPSASAMEASHTPSSITEPSSTQTAATATPTEPPSLFEDDFSDGLKGDWEIVLGSPFVVNEQLTADEITWLAVGDSSWADYSVQLTTEPRAAWFNREPDMVAVRVADMDNMIVFAWANYECVWYVVKDGDWREIPNSRISGGIRLSNKTLGIVAEGQKFTAYADGEKISSAFSSEFPRGRVALRVAPESVMDDFVIKALRD